VSLGALDDQLAFTANQETAKAGKVTVDFTNNSALQHDVVLTDSQNKIVGQTPVFQGGTKSFTHDARAWHLHLLLLRPGPSSGRDARNADGQVAAAPDAGSRHSNAPTVIYSSRWWCQLPRRARHADRRPGPARGSAQRLRRRVRMRSSAQRSPLARSRSNHGR
jgi:hypothetical protein